MMNLIEKINEIYPELKTIPFSKVNIVIQNDSDGRGDYIAKWEHPTLARPTQEQLDSVEE
jgi:hypothetical protein